MSLYQVGHGSFLSIKGTGLYSDASSWGKCNNPGGGGCSGATLGSGNWTAAGAGTPSSGSTIFVQGTINDAANGVANATILSGGNLTVTGQYPVSGSLTIKSGGTVINDDRLNFSSSSATFKIEDGGNLILNNYQNNPSAATGAIWSGDELFSESSKVTINYAYRASPLFTPSSVVSTNPTTNAKFGSLVIQPTSFNEKSTHWNGVLPSGSYQLTKKDLIINNNSDRRFTLNSDGPSDLIIGGNLFVNQTTSTTVTLSSGGTNTYTVLGNVTTGGSSTGEFTINGGGTSTLIINGNLKINTGTFRFGGYQTSTYSNLELKGNFELGSTALLVNSSDNYAVNNQFSFIGSGIPQTINAINQATSKYITFNVNSGAYVQLINQDFALGNSSSFNVKNGGVFDFGFNSSNLALNITNHVNSATFKTEANSTIKITSPEGITNTIGTGNVRTMITGRDFNVAGIYHYIGKVNQSSGNGLSGVASAKKVIVELETTNLPENDDLNFTVDGLKYFTSAGELEIRKGTVIDAPSNGFADATNEDGKLTMSSGRYKISRGGTQPSMGGDYNLTGGVIELAGGSAINIRTGVTPKQYLNIEVSGTNVTAGTTDDTGLTFQSGGTFTVKDNAVFKVPNKAGFTGTATSSIKNVADLSSVTLEPNSTIEYNRNNGEAQTITIDVVTIPADANYQNLTISGSGIKSPASNLTVNKITKVDAGTLKIVETLDNVMPNVFKSKKGVQVAALGNLILENNANLLQDTDAVNSGNVKAQRIAKLTFVSVATRADYNYWSSPVIAQKLLYNASTPGTSFSPGTPNNRIFQYKESTDNFVGTTDANFVAGKGYAIRAENAANGTTYIADGTAKTFEFIGEPNNGEITTPSLSWKDGDHGYNLIGNPYPSNIDFDKFWSANQTKMYSTAYFWTNNQYEKTQQGSTYSGNNYAIYNGTGGNPADYQGVSGSPVVPEAFIKPGQGFIVQTKSEGILSFKNDMREVGISPFFNNKGNAVAKNRFWLTMSSPSEIVNTILVGYIPGATNGFEKDFDAPLLVEGSDAFFSILDTEKLAIQGKEAMFNVNDVIPLGTKHFQNGTYEIALKQKEGIFETQNVYLKDKLLNTVVNLSENSYEFNATAGLYDNRFEIVYQPSITLGSNNLAKENVVVYHQGNNFVVKAQNKKITQLEMYDASGRLLYKTAPNNTEAVIDSTHLSNGMYVLKIGQNESFTIKRIVK